VDGTHLLTGIVCLRYSLVNSKIFVPRLQIKFMKKYRAFIVALAFVVVLPVSTHAEKLRVATLYIGSSMLPMWIAQEEGYFARRGLDVELV
jgi:ABC-type nitrate/sulfonate/bicarbonate transport system substrate-binding protein